MSHQPVVMLPLPAGGLLPGMRAVVAAAVACLTIAGCKHDVILKTQQVLRVEVSPSADTVDVGSTRTLSATIVVDNPSAAPPARVNDVTWTSSDTSRLAVSPGGNGSSVTLTGKGAGLATVTVTATSVADPSKVRTVTVVVMDKPGMSIALGAPSVSVLPGAAGTADVTLTRLGRMTSDVTMAVEGSLPNGVTVTPPAPFANGVANGVSTGKVTVIATNAATAGSFPLTVRAKATGLSDVTAPLSVLVPGYTVAFLPTTLTVVRGQSGTVTARVVAAGGFAGQVALTLDAAPAGLTPTLSATTVALGDSVRVTLAATPTATTGDLKLVLHGQTTGLAERRVEIPVTVRPAPAANLLVVAGDNQYGAASEGLPIDPTVQVVDANGVGVPGAVVRFTITGGGGGVTRAQDTTDVSGYARVGWTLGPTPIKNSLTASVSGVTGRSSVVLTAFVVRGQYGSVVAGNDFSCALNAQRAAVCWGDNTYGQLGDNTRAPHGTPKIVQTGAKFSLLVAGATHVCGLTLDAARQVYCWGRNNSGQIGDGTTTDRLFPVGLANVPVFSTLAAAGDHTCGIARETGLAYCWGNNADGQLGDATTVSHNRPVSVSNSPSFVTIAAGLAHTCGTTTGGAAVCWGRNTDGQLGDGTTSSHSTPTRVRGEQSFTAFALGAAHSCALTSDNKAYCWGLNDAGQLGTGNATPQLTPTAVATAEPLSQIVSRSSHTCAVTATSDALCWGANADGQLGDNSTAPHSAPASVGGGLKFVNLGAGAAHSCGVLTDGRLACWGKNASGQLGDNSNTGHPTPTIIP